MTNMAVGGLGPGFLLFTKHYNIGPREMSTVLTYPVLVLGLAVYAFFLLLPLRIMVVVAYFSWNRISSGFRLRYISARDLFLSSRR